MEPFRTLIGVAAPIEAANVDTDQIIPPVFSSRRVPSTLARFSSTTCVSVRKPILPSFSTTHLSQRSHHRRQFQLRVWLIARAGAIRSLGLRCSRRDRSELR